MSGFELHPGEEDEKRLKAEKLQEQLKATLQNAKTANYPPENDPKRDMLEDLLLDAKGAPIEVQRLSVEDAQAIRENQSKQNSIVVQQRRKVGSFLSWLSNTIGGIFHKVDYKKQCDNYGHIAPDTWGEGFPKCVQCGTEITSKDMLRGSSAR